MEFKEKSNCIKDSVYIDDGYSGANFDRPEFKRMLEDIRVGKVDCVVVKDLSRFGRDYIEAGRLIQKSFPALGVRFIAITDRFDSLTADYNEFSLVLPVKNFVNDSYCRDISNKVKSGQRVKREKGEFIGAFAVYGYCKDDKDKNKLVPDAYAAQIVQSIFAWKLDGMSTLAIAERLNAMGVMSPMEYKKSKGEKYGTGFAARVKAGWSPVAVKRILVDERYVGTMVQGKSEKLNYKLAQCRAKPREEWVRVEAAHTPIVTREDFAYVQRLLAVDSRALEGEKKAHLFSGLLFCGDCMEPMIRRVNRYKGAEKLYFICPTRNKGLGCTRHSILEKELEEAVWEGTKLQAALLLDEEKLHSGIGKLEVNWKGLAQFKQEIQRLYQEEKKYLALEEGLGEDLQDGVIRQEDFDTFLSIYEEEHRKIQEAIKRQKGALRSLFQSGAAAKMRLEQAKKALCIEKLSRDVLLAFIDRIMVYEDKRICLELRSKERFRKMVALSSGVGSACMARG